MPKRKKSSLSKSTSAARKKRDKQTENETDDEATIRRARNASSMALARANETPDEAAIRRARSVSLTRSARVNETHSETERRRARNASAVALARANETPDETAIRRAQSVSLTRSARVNETHSETERRRTCNASAMALARANETPDETAIRRAQSVSLTRSARANETHSETERRRARAASATTSSRRARQDLIIPGAALNYSKEYNYEEDNTYSIGRMNQKCRHCGSYNWKNERPGICCMNGKVSLPPRREPPPTLKALLTRQHPASSHYLSHIRAYNSAFQMTSFQAKEIREHGWMPTFKIQGQIYHRVGPLNHEMGTPAQFLQIYFVNDRENQADIRVSHISVIQRPVTLELQDMLHTNNAYVASFKCAKERMVEEDVKLVIRADKTPAGEHERRFNAPSTNEVAVLMVGDTYAKRDIVLEQRNSTLKIVSDTNRAYDSLQYPLLFPYGEDGYNFGLRQINPITQIQTNKKISAMSFYAYQLMQRDMEVNTLLMSKQLFHQYIVDMYTKVESERLAYLIYNQEKLRSDSYTELHDAISREDADVTNVGKLVVLPSSFTGGPRYMHMRTQDAMTYVRNFGCPDYFVTFTCNPKWVEIERELMPGQSTTDRPDLVARVFKLKITKLMELINKRQVFGKVRCHIYTIEWQKRGLPHAHILIWLHEKLRGEDIDRAISAELPDEQTDPILFTTIKSTMIHGPCGQINRNSPCMKDGKCTKRYPKQLTKETISDQEGYPLYRRRSPKDGGHTTTLRVKNEDVVVDNSWVVPYNPFLSRIFNAHINVECCSSIRSIKYVCKYINKGADMAVFSLERNGNDEVNEVEIFRIGRYVCTNEGVWRILRFDIHDRYPSVQHLAVHLENGQRVYFTEETAEQVARVPPRTTLTAFFELCSTDEFAKTLFYNTVPQYYTLTRDKKWKRRLVGKDVEGYPGVKSSDTLGRVYTIHPNNDECFYLRLLLHTVKGPTSYEDLKTVDDIICESFRESCNKRGLLQDDAHWNETMEEADIGESPRRLRNLFVVLIHHCEVSDPLRLWNQHKDSMSEDFTHAEGIDVPDDDVYNTTLIYIENRLLSFPRGKNNKGHGLPIPDRDNADRMPSEVRRERDYNQGEMADIVQERENALTPDQRETYEQIMEVIQGDNGGLLFLDAPGGTGKTYVLNLILAKIRAENDIAIAVASSGIAATLLRGGRTAHSTFKLALNLAYQDSPTCGIARQSATATLLRECKLIVWDECTMSHKNAFEAVDRTLRDLTKINKPMGGKVILLSGDFRQTLPIVRRGTKADEIRACVKSSYLWPFFVKFSLRTNMRAHLHGDAEAQSFADILMQIGNGDIPYTDSNHYIKVPEGCGNMIENIAALNDAIYPDLENNANNRTWLCERAILAPRNDTVAEINNELLKKMPGESMLYTSIDTVPDIDHVVDYPTEFLNSLEISGMPPHKLEVKVGTPIMLLRNLDAPKLCNGTRLIVTKLMTRLIEAEITAGQYEGEQVLLPRIPLKPSDCPFEFKRLQFPIKVCFAMSINKSQGQSLKVAGLSLANTCFSHGQFYVGCSRVGSSANLHILCEEGQTKNVVYKEALQ